MGRPREFEIDDAVDAGMRLFWTHGYEAASMADLVVAMGIAKSSFYNSFDGKRALLLLALDHYAETVVEPWIAGLRRGEEGHAAIARFLATLVDVSSVRGSRRGCLLGNTAAEVAPHDPAVAEKVAAGLMRIEAAFRAAVARGQAAGSIKADMPADTLARFLATGVQGLHLMSKAGASHDTLADAAGAMLAALD